MHTSQAKTPGDSAPANRPAVRLMVQLDATVDDGKIPRMCQTENLSKSGMLVRTRAPLPVGTRVAIQFLFRSDPALDEEDLPGGYAFVEGEAMVVRHTQPTTESTVGMGLQFLKLEEHGRNLLGRFLDLHGSPGAAAVPA